MDIVNRLKYYMDSIGAPISQFADNCGIPRPSMSQLLNGRNKRISDDVIIKIHSAYPDLSILWLMFGEGEMLENENIEISEPLNTTLDTDNGGQQTDVQDSENEDEHNFSFQNNPSDKSFDDNSLFDAPSQLTFEEESMTDRAQQPVSETIDQAAPPAPASPTKEHISFSESASRFHPMDVTHTVMQSGVADAQPTSAPEKRVSITPDSKKKITNIVVFYSDNSFQSFIPEA